MTINSKPHLVDINSPQAQYSAARLNAFKQEIIQQRWLSTLILSIHLDLEACLELLLTAASPAGMLENRKHNATFWTKLSRCSDQKLLQPPVVACLKAVNQLRNELAHRLENKPTQDSLFQFIESMSVMHPLSVMDGIDAPAKQLRTFSAIKTHFSGEEGANLENCVFASLMLLRATLFMCVNSIYDAKGV